MVERDRRAEAHDVIETVRQQYNDLTQSQKRIAEAIVDDPEFVAFATVDKLGHRLGVSPSTIVRFAYKVGLDGYQDLQARVRTLVRSQMRGVSDTSVDPGVTNHLGETTYAASLDRDLDHLQRTISGLDRETLDRAVGLLASAERIFITGDVTSYSVAYFTALAANRARDGVHLVRGDAEGAAHLLDIGPRDVVLAFTFPPYSTKVLRVVEWAIQRGATTIGVTDHAVSPAGRKVSLVLPAVTSGLVAQNTLVSALAVANALVNALILENEERSKTRYKAVNRLLGEWDMYVLGEDEIG